jgi:hypothetical protein
MATVLVIVTLVSMAMAIALGVIVLKLLREERRRSDARVIALTEMADAAAHASPMQAAEPARSMRAVPISRPIESHHAALGDEDFDRIDHVVTPGELFAVPEVYSPWPRRIGVVLALGLILAAMGVGVRSILLSRVPSDIASATPSQPSTQSPSGLLELLSLKHAQGTGTLTITGLVQNPREGVPLSKISATAFLFGADGTFIASGRAPLDFTMLRPGDESVFVISVPVSVPVARYRVGFRGDDGRIIGHVDRRGTVAVAQNHEF